MIFCRSLVISVVLSSVFNIAFATTNKDESCDDLMEKGTSLVTKTPGCALVNALMEGMDEEMDIDIVMAPPEAVKGVCNAEPSCIEELSSLISKGEKMGCQGWAPGENDNLDFIRQYSSDVAVFTGYMCENDCYAVTQAVLNGDWGAATCACLTSFVAKVDLLSEDGKGYLGIDSKIEEGIKDAIGAMKCDGKGLRSPAAQF